MDSEDAELEALRTALLASMKPLPQAEPSTAISNTVGNNNGDNDDEEEDEYDDLDALRLAALRSKNLTIVDPPPIRNNLHQAQRFRGRGARFYGRGRVRAHGRNRGPGHLNVAYTPRFPANTPRFPVNANANLIVINTVPPVADSTPNQDSKEPVNKSLQRPQDKWAGDESTSAASTPPQPKVMGKFARFDASDSDSDSSSENGGDDEDALIDQMLDDQLTAEITHKITAGDEHADETPAPPAQDDDDDEKILRMLDEQLEAVTNTSDDKKSDHVVASSKNNDLNDLNISSKPPPDNHDSTNITDNIVDTKPIINDISQQADSLYQNPSLSRQTENLQQTPCVMSDTNSDHLTSSLKRERDSLHQTSSISGEIMSSLQIDSIGAETDTCNSQQISIVDRPDLSPKLSNVLDESLDSPRRYIPEERDVHRKWGRRGSDSENSSSEKSDGEKETTSNELVEENSANPSPDAKQRSTKKTGRLSPTGDTKHRHSDSSHRNKKLGSVSLQELRAKRQRYLEQQGPPDLMKSRSEAVVNDLDPTSFMTEKERELFEARMKRFQPNAGVSELKKTVSLKGIVPRTKRKHRDKSGRKPRSVSPTSVRVRQRERRKKGDDLDNRKSNSEVPVRKTEADSEPEKAASSDSDSSDSEKGAWRFTHTGKSGKMLSNSENIQIFERPVEDLERERRQRLNKERAQERLVADSARGRVSDRGNRYRDDASGRNNRRNLDDSRANDRTISSDSNRYSRNYNSRDVRRTNTHDLIDADSNRGRQTNNNRDPVNTESSRSVRQENNRDRNRPLERRSDNITYDRVVLNPRNVEPVSRTQSPSSISELGGGARHYMDKQFIEEEEEENTLHISAKSRSFISVVSSQDESTANEPLKIEYRTSTLRNRLGKVKAQSKQHTNAEDSDNSNNSEVERTRPSLKSKFKIQKNDSAEKVALNSDNEQLGNNSENDNDDARNIIISMKAGKSKTKKKRKKNGLADERDRSDSPIVSITINQEVSDVPTEPSQPRASVLERLGIQVPSKKSKKRKKMEDDPEDEVTAKAANLKVKKQKKKDADIKDDKKKKDKVKVKVKRGSTKNQGSIKKIRSADLGPESELDEKIRKIQEKNAEILKRQREVIEDRKLHG